MAFGRFGRNTATTRGANVEKVDNTATTHPVNRSARPTIRSDVESAFIEFIGTFIFFFFALGGIQAAWDNSNDTVNQYGAGLVRPSLAGFQLWYISASMGFALLFASWVFYRVPGPIFNPNVATALLLTGYIRPVRWILYCIAEILGAIAASAMVLALIPGPLASNTFTGAGVNKVQGLFLEMFFTATLCLAVLMLSFERRGLGAVNVAPIGLGITLFSITLFGYRYTGAASNTARAFGPAVVSGFWGGHWIYWLGPFLGSLLAAGFYHIIRRTRLWNADPTDDGIYNRFGYGGNGDNFHGGGRYGTTGAPNTLASGSTADPNYSHTHNLAPGRSSGVTATTAEQPLNGSPAVRPREVV